MEVGEAQKQKIDLTGTKQSMLDVCAWLGETVGVLVVCISRPLWVVLMSVFFQTNLTPVYPVSVD